MKEFWIANDEDFFTEGDLSGVLNFSKSWFRAKRQTGGGIPYYKVEHKCLYKKKDVLEWLAKQPVKTKT